MRSFLSLRARRQHVAYGAVALIPVVFCILAFYLQLGDRKDTGSSSPDFEAEAAKQANQPLAVPHQTLRREEVLTISGNVQDETGQPIREAVVRVWTDKMDSEVLPPLDANLPTGPDGAYSVQVRDADETYLFQAEAPGYGRAEVTAVVPDGGLTGFDFILTKAASLAGRVVDLGHNPIADVTLTLFHDSGQSYPMDNLTGEDGRFRFTGLLAGDYRVIGRYCPSGAREGSAGIHVGSALGNNPEDILATVHLRQGEDRTGFEIVFPWAPGPAVAGHVVDENGNRIPDATIWATYYYPDSLKPTGFAREKTDEFGRFQIDYLEPHCSGDLVETVTLVCECEDYERSHVPGVSIGARHAKIVLKKAERGAIAGKVIDAETGKGLSGISVYLGRGTTAWGERYWQENIRKTKRATSWFGEFRIDSVPPGTSSLILYSERFGVITRTGIHVRPNETTEVEVALRRSGTLRVEIDYVGIMEGRESKTNFHCWPIKQGDQTIPLERHLLNDLQNGPTLYAEGMWEEGIRAEVPLSPGEYRALVRFYPLPLEVSPNMPACPAIFYNTLVEIVPGETTVWAIEAPGEAALSGALELRGEALLGRLHLFLTQGGDLSKLLSVAPPFFHSYDLKEFYVASQFDSLIELRPRQGATSYRFFSIPEGPYILTALVSLDDGQKFTLSSQLVTLNEDEEKIVDLVIGTEQ